MKTRLLIIPLILLTACTYPKLEFEKESGKVNKVRVGDKFRISLPEDHKTTYLWALQKDIHANRIQYYGSVFHGTYVDFNFEAVGKGPEELAFTFYCAKDTAQVKKFLVEVE